MVIQLIYDNVSSAEVIWHPGIHLQEMNDTIKYLARIAGTQPD
jgi:hypothetical protein